jgi:hypothetical protein
MSAPDTVTVLRAHGRRLAKTIRADGSIDGYDNVRTVDLFEFPVADLGGLGQLLNHLERRPDCCVVRGAIADANRTVGVRRLLYRDPETGDEPTLRDAPRWWVALDIDSLPLPASVEPEDLGGCASAAIKALPEVFRPARAIAQATGSHALKPGIRLRLWYWLDRPASGGELKVWLRSVPVDHRVFGPAQVIYTASPRFLPGAFDPLPTRLALIPGASEVIVPPSEALRPPPRPKIVFKNTSDDDRTQREIDGLVRLVAGAADGNRNSMLYWASRCVAEKVALHAIAPDEARFLLEKAALEAGLSANEVAATVRSGLRHGDA